MKAYVFSAPGKMVWKDIPEPETGEPYGAILSPVALSCCTSDVHTVFGGGKPKQTMHVLGHECVARVIKTGAYVKDFKVGDVVAVPAITPDWRATDSQEGCERHAIEHFSGHRLGRTMPGVFAEYFSVLDADTTLAHIPNGVTIKQALMCVDVMTTGLTGAEYAEIQTGDTVCVIGIGPVGLMAIAGAVHMGASRVIAIGSRAKCVEMAGIYGASDILSYKEGNIAERVLEMTDGKGADSVIIAGGGDNVFTQAIDMVKYGKGVVSNINYYGGEGYLAFPKFSGGRGMAGKTVHTELAKGGRARIERMLKMVQYGRIDPEPLITHTFYGLKNVEKALLLTKEKPEDLIKTAVIIDEVNL